VALRAAAALLRGVCNALPSRDIVLTNHVQEKNAMDSYRTVFGSLEKAPSRSLTTTRNTIAFPTVSKSHPTRSHTRRGYSPKRSMLIVWENNDDRLPHMYGKGELKPYPVEF
jgi:hypothetical protein